MDDPFAIYSTPQLQEFQRLLRTGHAEDAVQAFRMVASSMIDSVLTYRAANPPPVVEGAPPPDPAIELRTKHQHEQAELVARQQAENADLLTKQQEEDAKLAAMQQPGETDEAYKLRSEKLAAEKKAAEPAKIQASSEPHAASYSTPVQDPVSEPNFAPPPPAQPSPAPSPA